MPDKYCPLASVNGGFHYCAESSNCAWYKPRENSNTPCMLINAITDIGSIYQPKKDGE